jgi:hypothetical protein
MDDNKITLRSYRLAFDLERRLHRVDRFRIPVPYGIPLTALGYAASGLLLVLVLRHLPVASALLAVLPLPIQLVLLPGAASFLLCRVRPDGRPAHEAVLAWLVYRATARHLVTLRPCGGPRIEELDEGLSIAGDERDPVLRPGRVSGPAVVRLGQPVRITPKGRRLALVQLEDRPLARARELEVGDRQVLVIG